MLKQPYEAELEPLDVSLEEVKRGQEIFFKISHVNRMRPFFMTIVSDSNHWLFVSSNGGISAGRKNADFALFPYGTDDKITDSAENTGCKTILRIQRAGETFLWEPFSIRSEDHFDLQRNLYKNRFGNKVVFEEINLTLGLVFSYEWNTSDKFGFVRKASLVNQNAFPCEVSLIDGFQNLLPFGVGADLQNSASNLADAYKRSELRPDTGLGIFALSAIIVDKAEPSEALKANIVWSSGLENPIYLLSTRQLPEFRKGEGLTPELDVKGDKGAYLVGSSFVLEANATRNWILVANVNQSQSQVIQLHVLLGHPAGLVAEVLDDIQSGTRNLVALAASSDALQLCSDDRQDTRHFSNVLFNIMRGGIFDNGYNIEKKDFTAYLLQANREIAGRNKEFLNTLPDVFSLSFLKEKVVLSGDAGFNRLAAEYLPLKFSRRHGDPSRPWNKFSINTKSDLDGSKILDYEGNWRDIFQNWEALAHSFPEFIEGMVFKFLNASTFDGYNPYRVTKGGFDWETIEPENPWSYIGYWGDHQIIYLLKLLEFAHSRRPEQFTGWFSQDGFVYANVPYQIKPYGDICKNPKDTILFDHKADVEIRKKMEILGADGALLTNQHGSILQVGFVEKILATVLAKLSNLVPDGGIWMNTQRPEWNDANNALVGNGLSMVTVCYLRRFLAFFIPVFEEHSSLEHPVSEEVWVFFSRMKEVFVQNQLVLNGPVGDELRKTITDALGMSGSDFRSGIYNNGFSGKTVALPGSAILECFRLANTFLEHAIKENRRADDLFHTYNLISSSGNSMQVSHLNEMLEGQVAVLSSGSLSAAESLKLLDALRASSLYREDQNSYILYPNKALPGFLQKNSVSREAAEGNALLKKLLADGNRTIVETDILGQVHFNANFRNANDLKVALDNLGSEYKNLLQTEGALVEEFFERVFNHKEFTGRSGTFFGYEGLGSIYWHMVSKLLLAVQETCLQAILNHSPEEDILGLIRHYYAIQDGIGVHKSPDQYGAFPTDPYSHTPLGKGAQQPGMTGQVKEDILCRVGELGLFVEKGKLNFNPSLLKKNQFLEAGKQVEYVDGKGNFQTIQLEASQLFFTYCQVPVVYCLDAESRIEIFRQDGLSRTSATLELSESESRSVFQRTGEVESIKVHFKETQFRI
jgi:hypothetical protein